MKKLIVALGVIFLIIWCLLVALPFITVIKQLNFDVNVPKSNILLFESFVVPSSSVIHSIHLNAGDNVSMIVTVKEQSVQFADGFIDFSVNNGSKTYLSFENISHLPIHYMWAGPNSTNYNFVYDNAFSSSSKKVTVELTADSSETEHYSIPLKGRLIPLNTLTLGRLLSWRE